MNLNKKLVTFGIVLAAGLMVTSCKKKGCTDPTANNYSAEAKKDDNSCTYDDPDTGGETFVSIDTYWDTKEVPTQTFSVDAATGGTFTGAAGSVITIPANAFEKISGAPVSGTVTVTLKELFTNAQIMNSGVYPISGGTFLNSGGEYFLGADQGGNRLRIVDGEMINLEIPAQAEDPGMQLFFNAAAFDDSIFFIEDSIDWDAIDTIGTASGFTFNSADDTYSIDLDSLGWGNIDAFDFTITYFDCYFNLTGLSGLNNSNTTAFAVFKDQNSVWPVGGSDGWSWWGDITGNLVTETHLGAIPMNIVVISVVGSQLYYGLLDVTPASEVTYDIPMTATTSDNLDNVISTLE